MSRLLPVYQSRPFKTRNADEFALEDILELFIAPVDGLNSPFEYENNIVKGKMGAGKTMFLRANFAYYLYSIVPSLLDSDTTTLPILIRLSDFQHLRSPEKIYSSVIISILEQLCDLPLQLADADRLATLHQGLQSLPDNTLMGPRQGLLKNVLRMKADEYVETVSSTLGLRAGAKHDFFEATAEYKKDYVLEVKGKDTPGISDVFNAYNRLIGSRGNLLLLIDEAGALDRSFFSGSPGSSLFETLMNQLRTAPYIRTKVAIYPHSYSDVLTETRYGDAIFLTENVATEDGYRRFRGRAIALMDRYVGLASKNTVTATDIFDIDGSAEANGDGLEQIIYGSAGNVRRLVQLLDQSMAEAFRYNSGNGKVLSPHIEQCLKTHAAATEINHLDVDRTFLESIATACRARGTYRFQFPYKAPVLSKYVTRSEEHNLLNIVDPGAGRRGTVYAFDYAYCVAHEIPTHLVRGTEKIDKTRSLSTGMWATRVAQISEELVAQANIPKEEGSVGSWFGDKGGFILSASSVSYYFRMEWLIEGDKMRTPVEGQRVRFYPASGHGQPYALMVEFR